MSYILEALQKSERQRAKEAIQPAGSLLAPQQTSRPRKPVSGRRIRTLFVIVLLLGVAGGFILSRDLAAPGPTEKQPAGLSRSVTLHPAREAARPPATQPIDRKPDKILVINRQQGDTLPPSNLPIEVQTELRRMQFAGHAWSRDPALRLIMINDSILHEGDPIDAHLRLIKITENGVILGYRSRRIRINLFPPGR